MLFDAVYVEEKIGCSLWKQGCGIPWRMWKYAGYGGRGIEKCHAFV